MSEVYKPDDNDGQNEIQPISHRRILIEMVVLAVVGSFLTAIFISLGFGFGFLFGAAVSFINYWWMKVSLKRIFERAVGSGEKPRFLASRYVLRYLLIGLVLVVVYLTKLVPITSVIFGLASFAFAVMIEGFIRIFNSDIKNKEL